MSFNKQQKGEIAEQRHITAKRADCYAQNVVATTTVTKLTFGSTRDANTGLLRHHFVARSA